MGNKTLILVLQIMIVIAELLVDWLKHAFITKFNEIPAIVYRGITIRGIDFYCEHKLLYNTFVCMFMLCWLESYN